MPHHAAARFIRAHILTMLAVVVVVGLGANTYATIRVTQLSDQIIEARQHDCRNGNVVRGHIQFVTAALHDLLVLSLTAPPRQPETPVQQILRQRFQDVTDRLAERLPALAPRDCSRSGVTGAGAVPGAP